MPSIQIHVLLSKVINNKCICILNNKLNVPQDVYDKICQIMNHNFSDNTSELFIDWTSNIQVMRCVQWYSIEHKNYTSHHSEHSHSVPIPDWFIPHILDFSNYSTHKLSNLRFKIGRQTTNSKFSDLLKIPFDQVTVSNELSYMERFSHQGVDVAWIKN